MGIENLIDSASWARFAKLRSSLFEAIDLALKVDGHHKSYEGALTVGINLPNVFDDRDGALPTVTIALSCYVIGPSRGETWSGFTFEEALSKAEKELGAWIAESVSKNAEELADIEESNAYWANELSDRYHEAMIHELATA
jgi:hypothetical protein